MKKPGWTKTEFLAVKLIKGRKISVQFWLKKLLKRLIIKAELRLLHAERSTRIGGGCAPAVCPRDVINAQVITQCPDGTERRTAGPKRIDFSRIDHAIPDMSDSANADRRTDGQTLIKMDCRHLSSLTSICPEMKRECSNGRLVAKKLRRERDGYVMIWKTSDICYDAFSAANFVVNDRPICRSIGYCACTVYIDM